MGLSILGGLARSYSLSVPKGDTIRPTSVMLRRKLFDSYQDCSKYTFIDACAGTGAVGIEAWSRGAKEVILIEQSKNVFRFTKENVQGLKSKYSKELKERPIRYSQANILSYLSIIKDEYIKWDKTKRDYTIFFFDPPYHEAKLYQKVIEEVIVGESWFSGILWLESDRQKAGPVEYWDKIGPSTDKVYAQGTSYVLVKHF